MFEDGLTVSKHIVHPLYHPLYSPPFKAFSVAFQDVLLFSPTLYFYLFKLYALLPLVVKQLQYQNTI